MLGRNIHSRLAVCGNRFLLPAAYFLTCCACRLLWYKLGKVSLSRHYGDRVTEGNDFVLSMCIRESTLFNN